ncbi:MAG: major tail protein [Bacillus sp. (in: firmicutes)]
MAEEKNYRASTGVDEFYYGILNESDVVEGSVERVKFLQEITVEMPQEITRAYGDNKTAELAVSNGNVSVTSRFHKLPEEDKEKLFGIERTTDGLMSFGSSDAPPYTAAVFARTYEDGSKEWVGLPKGMFLRPNIGGTTKEDGVDFSNEEITAEFMDRTVTGFSDEKSVIFGKDPKGTTKVRDALFLALFGKEYPGTETP